MPLAFPPGSRPCPAPELLSSSRHLAREKRPLVKTLDRAVLRCHAQSNIGSRTPLTSRARRPLWLLSKVAGVAGVASILCFDYLSLKLKTRVAGVPSFVTLLGSFFVFVIENPSCMTGFTTAPTTLFTTAPTTLSTAVAFTTAPVVS